VLVVARKRLSERRGVDVAELGYNVVEAVDARSDLPFLQQSGSAD